MDGPVLCPIRFCTGAACPGCGLSRSVVAALRGDFDLSWQMHPLTGLFALEILAVGLAVLGFGRERVARHTRTFASVNGVVLAATWVVRWRLGLLDVVTQV